MYPLDFRGCNMPRFRRIPWRGLLFVLCPVVAMTDVAAGQEAAVDDSPESVVRAAFTALDEKRWMDVAELMHPEELEQFRVEQLEWMRSWEERPEPPPRNLDVPEAVAEWFAQQEERFRQDDGSMIARTFAGVQSLDELRDLSAAEMFARHLQAEDPGTQVAGALDSADRPLPPELADRIALRPEREVVGSVAESESLVDVVYRTAPARAFEPWASAKVHVVRVARTPTGWRIIPAGEPFGTTTSTMLSITVTRGEGNDPREEAERGITWGDGGRAFFTGFPEGPLDRWPPPLPATLVIEQRKPDGSTERIEIPTSAFGALSELLLPWSFLAASSPSDTNLPN